jgi:hypothetical protein
MHGEKIALVDYEEGGVPMQTEIRCGPHDDLESIRRHFTRHWPGAQLQRVRFVQPWVARLRDMREALWERFRRKPARRPPTGPQNVVTRE